MNEGLIALDPGISHRGVSSESPRLGRRNSQRATNFPTLRLSSTAWLRDRSTRRRDGDDHERPANMSGVDHGCVTLP